MPNVRKTYYRYGPDWCKFYYQSWTKGNYQSG